MGSYSTHASLSSVFGVDTHCSLSRKASLTTLSLTQLSYTSLSHTQLQLTHTALLLRSLTPHRYTTLSHHPAAPRPHIAVLTLIFFALLY